MLVLATPTVGTEQALPQVYAYFAVNMQLEMEISAPQDVLWVDTCPDSRRHKHVTPVPREAVDEVLKRLERYPRLIAAISAMRASRDEDMLMEVVQLSNENENLRFFLRSIRFLLQTKRDKTTSLRPPLIHHAVDFLLTAANQEL